MIDREIRRLLRVDKLLAVLLDALSDHGIVDDRHELCDMLTEHIVEQTAVAVEHIHQEAALLDPRALALHLLIDALRLLSNRVNMRRQEARKSKLCALVGTERRPLVLKWIAQQSIAFLFHIFLLFADKIYLHSVFEKNTPISCCAQFIICCRILDRHIPHALQYGQRRNHHADRI